VLGTCERSLRGGVAVMSAVLPGRVSAGEAAWSPLLMGASRAGRAPCTELLASFAQVRRAGAEDERLRGLHRRLATRDAFAVLARDLGDAVADALKDVSAFHAAFDDVAVGLQQPHERVPGVQRDRVAIQLHRCDPQVRF
jgi:hypothetical protein